MEYFPASFMNYFSQKPEMLIVIGLLIVVAASSGARDLIQGLTRLFLYRESSQDLTSSIEKERLKELEKKLNDLEKDVSGNVLKNKTKLIDSEVDRYIDSNLASVLKSKINDPELIKDTVVASLGEDVRLVVEKEIAGRNIGELQEATAREKEMTYRQSIHSSLRDTLEREARNSSMLKMVMINLFVLSTIAFLVFNIFNREALPDNAYFPILGIYFSLGAFMLYIIRTSHFRSSVLMAIKEDERNHHNMIDYLQKIRNGAPPSEYDIDIARLIMTNRSEREQKANHPYEVILKEVSGTNIQFKGGKMSLGRKNETV